MGMLGWDRSELMGRGAICKADAPLLASGQRQTESKVTIGSRQCSRSFSPLVSTRPLSFHLSLRLTHPYHTRTPHFLQFPMPPPIGIVQLGHLPTVLPIYYGTPTLTWPMRSPTKNKKKKTAMRIGHMRAYIHTTWRVSVSIDTEPNVAR